MWIVCLADNSHEMSRLILSEKWNKMSSATNFALHFKGEDISDVTSTIVYIVNWSRVS